ncbi:39S ribosomal protein L41, mitochondrial-like [Oppia nitens]|uniref:39S ribosomal protein L41, mitochondrial-like n=1 Tax=Oppia nitens TaxID=1686743 RepID=UPI0023DB8DEC|nr:39S ribosomal protein L41, mitochondrial-like [Oppia nitens]
MTYKMVTRCHTNQLLSKWLVSGLYRQTTGFHTSSRLDVRNFRRFMVPNKRGQFEHPRLPKPLLEKEFDYPVFRDTLFIRWPGYWFKGKFVYVKEMEPQIIVPDLQDFHLKPYVSYRCPDITQSAFTARDLFNATLADSIIEKFKNGEDIDHNVTDEDIQKAKIKAKQTGADLFSDTNFFGIQ